MIDEGAIIAETSVLSLGLSFFFSYISASTNGFNFVFSF